MSAKLRTILAGAIVFALPAASLAQQQATQRVSTSGPRWEVEGHGGWFGANDVTSGTPIEGFARGATIPSLTSNPPITSRAVSSWYFGDGAVLLAEVFALTNRPQRIAPLDNTLKTRVARREGGGSVGFRVSRQVTPRFSAEFNFDRVLSSIVLADGVETALQATRGSFESVFRSQFSPPAEISSLLTIDPGGDYSQRFITGAVNYHFGTFGHVSPYVTGGLGGVFNSGDAPAATLTGYYLFSPIPQVALHETDTVTVHAVVKDQALVGVFGGGARFHVSRRHGVRADLRVHLSENLVSTTVDAAPVRAPGGTSSAIFVVLTNPALQFASGPAPSLRSSLSGPSVNGLETFSASGTQLQVNFSVGYFFRF